MVDSEAIGISLTDQPLDERMRRVEDIRNFLANRR